MLRKVQTYLDHYKNLIISRFTSRQVLGDAKNLCSISVTPKELLFVYARNASGQPDIEVCESYPYQNEEEFQTLLNDLVKNHQLKNVACSLLLQEEDYQLLITDALPVNDTEFQDAIRWKIKDLIRYPINDAIIDSFKLPKMKTGANKIMVVATLTSKLEQLRHKIQQAGLSLQVIDIQELALRNLAALYAKDDKTTALIFVQENDIQLLFIAKQQIYISRLLKITIDAQDENNIMQAFERLASEIQRSYNYFQNLWDIPIPSVFLFGSTKQPIPQQALDLLAQNINTRVETIHVEGMIKHPLPKAVTPADKFLPLMGSIFRGDMQTPQQVNLYRFLPQIKKTLLTPKIVLGSYASFLLLLSLIYLLGLWHNHQIKKEFAGVTTQSAAIQSQLNKLTQEYPVIDEESLKKNILALQQEYRHRSSTLDLVSPNAHFSRYLIGLGDTIVPGVWLTEINFNREKVKMDLKGHALQSVLLKDFFSRLTNWPMFANFMFSLNEISEAAFPASFYITAKQENKV